MKDLLIKYRDRLTDLTARNKSLRLLRLTQKNSFDLAYLSKIEQDLGSKVLSRVVKLDQEIRLFPQGMLAEEAVLANRNLTQLKREIDLIEQETGNRPLYVAYGFLEGEIAPDFYLRCPLLFYSVRLVKITYDYKPYWGLKVDDDVTPFINRTFLMAVTKYLGGNIEASIIEEMEQLPDKLDEVLPFLQNLLLKHNITVRYMNNSSLSWFPNLKKDEIVTGGEGFQLMPYAILGKFQQSASTLLNDYEELIKQPPKNGFLEGFFGEGSLEEPKEKINGYEILNKSPLKDNYFVLDTDASQEAVVIASREQKGLIVHGPPGSGKSQVIVNLIVDRLIQGQKVLLVCQKPTALEVVYNRIGQLDLQHQIVLVHDYSHDKSHVYQKIADVLERPEVPSSKEYNRLSNEKEKLADELNQISNSLHQVRPFGKSLFFLYSRARYDTDTLIDVQDLIGTMTFDELQTMLQELRLVIDLKAKYDHPAFSWFQRKSFHALNVQSRLILQKSLEMIAEDMRIGSMIQKSIQARFTPEEYLMNENVLIELSEGIAYLKNRQVHSHCIRFFTDPDREFENEDHLISIDRQYVSLVKKISVLQELPEPVEHLSTQEAREIEEQINQFDSLNQKLTRFFNPDWWRLRKKLQEVCRREKLVFSGTSVRYFRDRLRAYLLFESLRSDALGFGFFKDVPAENELKPWQAWIALKNEAKQFLKRFVQAQNVFPDWLKNPEKTDDLKSLYGTEFQNELTAIVSLNQKTGAMLDGVQTIVPYLDSAIVQSMKDSVNQGDYQISYISSLQKGLDHFDSMVRLDQMKISLGMLETELLIRCEKHMPIEDSQDPSQDWITLIENSFYHNWILKVEDAEPHLINVSTELYQKKIERFAQLLSQRRKIVPSIVDHKVFVRSTEVQGANRQKIRSEANKKRKQLPLRKIVGSFFDDVLKLVPCWLCTPEAVSAIFPLEQELFDLVIFDEASQCPLENAIPSVYRAKQLIVAGDEKQLPPTNFFKSADEEEDEDDESEDYVDKIDQQAKSLLEWSKSKLQDQWLTWHYRSDYEELINFSNYAFYDKRIQIAPTVTRGAAYKPIEFIQVNGVWRKQTNVEEANEIVRKVFDILRNDERNPTLGIITFNKRQTDLIQDTFERYVQENPHLLTLYEQAKNRKLGEEHIGLFVKNIENVQGDERDIILFSVAYANDPEGKFVSQFGPLSREGGGNRLNVAISRAKKKVYIVCSFDPSGWQRAETYSRGVKLLKRYLEYGKAVSEGNRELASTILESVLDSTNIKGETPSWIFDSVFEEEVCNQLTTIGYEVHTQVGFSGYRIDLAIVEPVRREKYILGIECDGATYHSSKVARERDLYRQRFLESKGWKIHRIWSRNWWTNRDRELEKVKEIVDRISEKVTSKDS